MTQPPHPDSPHSDNDRIAFAPFVSKHPRRDGWTVERQRRFVEMLQLTGSVAKASAAVGLSVASVYALRKRVGAEGFAAAWDEAVEMGRDRAFDIAVDRAVNGVTMPRFYRGRFVGTTHRFDTATIMRALMPRAVPPKR